MLADESEEQLLRSVALQNAKSILIARRRMERELIEVKETLERRTGELEQSEARYRSALTAGLMGNWETDLVAGTRTWSKEGMALFGLTLVDGRGRVGGEADEFRSAMHPDDRHLLDEFRAQAARQDSFTAEYRIVRPDGKIRWLSGRGQVVARGPGGEAQRLINVVMDITHRKAAEDHIQFLMDEITHRSKNLLAVVQAIAGQIGRTSHTIDEFQKRFTQRLQGLAASHDLLVGQNWQGASLVSLVRDQLSPFAEVGGQRLTMSGPDILLNPKAVEAIGLALHELATNAVKYGALSVPVGKVAVSWTLEDRGMEAGRLHLNWIEQGGPVVTAPSGKGFGHVVFEKILAQSFSGKVKIDFAANGLIWELSIPAANLVTERDGILEPAGFRGDKKS